MSAVNFDVLDLLPKMFEKMEEMQTELTELRQQLKPKFDLTKRAGVKAFLDISDGTLNNMMKDGRFKENIHYTKQIKGKKIMISFVENGILAYKKGLK
ncbi:hypothetical protein N5U04_11100 [Aliarcobacter butzleri]|uniref:DNA-binding protein n=1 Tax=Arcobacter lacus TaxID=1912876 RepID=A0ABX5JKV5_9BACT|nr:MULTISPECIES: hypothetical protein [Arcobacteraceae]MCT7549852.1 hypothetical protein [Aliarcobacter butzleri]MCT7560116.1 hypothetical protein [Aliarcobacter butzleri]MCT7614695.1 hypothetical protein [Aliarcobacter butzleri]PUE67408.1 hypothetical protein B0175_00045 [Arcobacter lacus]